MSREGEIEKDSNELKNFLVKLNLCDHRKQSCWRVNFLSVILK